MGRPDPSPATIGRLDPSPATAGTTMVGLRQGGDDDGGDGGDAGGDGVTAVEAAGLGFIFFSIFYFPVRAA